MSRTVHKFILDLDTINQIELGADPRVVLVASQYAPWPTIWIEHEPGVDLTEHAYIVVGTGHQLPLGVSTHVGSAVCDPYVWHVYELSTA